MSLTNLISTEFASWNFTSVYPPRQLWMDKLINGEAANVTDLSKQLGLKTGYVTRILSLNSLAPDIVEAILAGIEPDGLSIAKLTEQPIPEDWNEQRRLYGFPQR